MTEEKKKHGMDRRDFIDLAFKGTLGFGLMLSSPSLFTVSRAEAGTGKGEEDLGGGMEFYHRIRKTGAAAPLFVTFDIQPFEALNNRLGKYRAKDNLSAKEKLGIIRQLGKADVLSLCLLGGSLFSEPRIMEYIETAHKSGLSVSATTGGTGLSDDHIKKLAAIPFFNLKVNIDGSTAEVHDRMWGPGSFDVAISAIKRAVANKINVTAVTFVTPANYGDVEKIIALSGQLGVKVHNVRRYIPLEQDMKMAASTMISPDQAKKLLEDIGGKVALKEAGRVKVMVADPFGGDHANFVQAGVMDQRNNLYAWNTMCQSGCSYCHIASTGKVVPCTWLASAAGDLKKTPFMDIWRQSGTFKKLRGRESFDECIAHSHLATGKILARDPLAWT